MTGDRRQAFLRKYKIIQRDHQVQQENDYVVSISPLPLDQDGASIQRRTEVEGRTLRQAI
jgi:hypothetical protein